MKILELLASILTSLSKYFRNFIKKKSEFDSNLFEKFLDELPSNSPSIRFLAEHDIGTAYKKDELKDLYDFLYTWDNAEHEFKNRKLENLRKEFITKSYAFLGELAMNVWPVKNNPDFYSMHLSGRQYNKERMERRDELNEKAIELYNIHQNIVRMGNKKLK